MPIAGDPSTPYDRSLAGGQSATVDRGPRGQLCDVTVTELGRLGRRQVSPAPDNKRMRLNAALSGHSLDVRLRGRSHEPPTAGGEAADANGQTVAGAG